MAEVRCKHELHESMRGKPLEKWHIYIHEGPSIKGSKQNGDLIMAIFDQHGKSWDVLAVGVDGKLHLFVGLPNWIEGIKVDSKGRIVVES